MFSVDSRWEKNFSIGYFLYEYLNSSKIKQKLSIKIVEHLKIL